MSVTLRKRKLGSGKTTLYLDYYKDGIREYEYLKIYLIPGEKIKNSEKLEIAARIRSERELELLNTDHYIIKVNKKEDFVEFFLKVVKEREGRSDYNSWWSTYIQLKNFANETLSFADITDEKLNDFKTYLSTVAKKRSDKKLSQNTKRLYFFRLKEAISLATEKGLITPGVGVKVKHFKLQASQKGHYSFEEINKLLKAECTLKPIYRDAFIFSCLTGLRWSDIFKMTWDELIERPEGMVYMFRQRKTSDPEYLPLSAQSLKFLPKKTDSNKVWDGLVYSHTNNLKLDMWLNEAGLKGKRRFHEARHTFATQQLTFGTDLYTVSKLLGHTSIKNTEIYAKIIDKKKTEAVKNVPDLDI